jgi:hypothetical protein
VGKNRNLLIRPAQSLGHPRRPGLCEDFRRLSRLARRARLPRCAPLARALIAANPEPLVWGSDWPHPDSYKVAGRKPTDIAPALPIDDGRVLNLLAELAPGRRDAQGDPGGQSEAACTGFEGRGGDSF